VQKGGKFHFPFDREPAFENRYNLFRPNFLERRAKATRFWSLNLSCHPAVDFVRAKFFRQNREQPIYDVQPFGIVLALGFANEIVDPKVALILKRSPNLFGDMLEK